MKLLLIFSPVVWLGDVMNHHGAKQITDHFLQGIICSLTCFGDSSLLPKTSSLCTYLMTEKTFHFILFTNYIVAFGQNDLVFYLTSSPYNENLIQVTFMPALISIFT